MATAEAPGEKFAKGCFFVAVAVITLLVVARCTIGHHIGQKHDHDRDLAQARSVALARTFAEELATTRGPTPAARAATAAGHKGITVRAVDGQAVTVEISMPYGGSALGAGDLITCFRVVPPATDPAEVTCPEYPTY